MTTAGPCDDPDPPPVEPATKFIIEYAPYDDPLGALQSSAFADRIRAEVRAAYGLADKVVGTAGRLPYEFVNDLSPEDSARIAADPRVRGVHRNRYRDRQVDQSLRVIEQPKAYSWGATGKGYAVAILDTGADYHHPDLGSCEQPGPDCRVVVSLDMAAEDSARDADPDKHGTNVAAIVAKVAPEASIIALDVFEPGGAADSDVLKALNWVLEHRAEYGIVAVNMSLGSSENHMVACNKTVYDSAFEWLLLDGIQVVVAAGNEGVKTGLSNPACHPLAIAVGATTDTLTAARSWAACSDPALQVDMVPCFSNSASSLDILAPGTNITAGGTTLSGTSMAAPHVTGALAALKSKFPHRTNAELLLRLQQTGLKVTDRNGVSARRINMASAMNDPPVANDDAVVVLQGGGAVINVLANDTLDENPAALTVVGATAPPGDTTFVTNNMVYLLLGPGSTGNRQFRYTIRDEYGDTDVATVNVTVQPSAFPSARRVTEESSLLSRLGKQRGFHYLVYESVSDGQRAVWYQTLDSAGVLQGDRWQMNRSESPNIQPNDLAMRYNDDGFTAVWISNNFAGDSHIIAVNYPLPQLGTPFVASFNYANQPAHPWLALLPQLAVTGWEQAWNPTQLAAQATSRNAVNPSPHGGVQQLTGWVGRTVVSETVTVEPARYIHLRSAESYGAGIAARKFDATGNPDWAAEKKLFTSSTDFGVIADFSSVRTDIGFAVALSHGRYAGRYAISFQEFNASGEPAGAVVPVITGLHARGDVDLLHLEDGAWRVFWWEEYPQFAVLLSSEIRRGLPAGAPVVEYWTLEPNAYAPYEFKSLSLGDKYVLSWSNNARKLTMTTRERF